MPARFGAGEQVKLSWLRKGQERRKQPCPSQNGAVAPCVGFWRRVTRFYETCPQHHPAPTAPALRAPSAPCPASASRASSAGARHRTEPRQHGRLGLKLCWDPRRVPNAPVTFRRRAPCRRIVSKTRAPLPCFLQSVSQRGPSESRRRPATGEHPGRC